MSIFDNFPYSNTHQINLDWVLEKVREAVETSASAKVTAENLKSFVENYLKNLGVQDEISAKLDSMAADGSLGQIFAYLYAGYVTPELYGAKGDGNTDDSAAIQRALNSGMPVKFLTKTYGISSMIILPPNANLSGDGSVIKLLRENVDAKSMFYLYNNRDNNIKFDVNMQGITFDGCNNVPTLVRIENYSASESAVNVEKCCFYNAYWSNTYATSDRNAFIAIVGNYKSAVVKDSIFDMCGRDAGVGKPAIYGSHSVDITNSVIDGNNCFCKHIIFERNVVSNVYTDDDPYSEQFVDCDGLRFFTNSAESHITIAHNTFVDCIGRAIKIHSYGNVTVCNNSFYQEKRTRIEHGIFVDSQFPCNNIIKNNFLYRKTIDIDSVRKLNVAKNSDSGFGAIRVVTNAEKHFDISNNTLSTDKEVECYICGIIVDGIANGVYGVISNNTIKNITAHKLVSMVGVLGVRCDLLLENQVNPTIKTGLYFDNMSNVYLDPVYWDVAKYRITIHKCEFAIQFIGNLQYIIVDGDYEDMYTDNGRFIRHRIYTSKNYKAQYCVAKFVCGSVGEGVLITHLVEWLYDKQKEGYCIIKDITTNKTTLLPLSTAVTTNIVIDGEPTLLKFRTGTGYVAFDNTSPDKSYEIEIFAKMV